MSAQDLKQQRKELAHRQRRIIFNNDGCDVTHECKVASPQELLKCRTTGLLGSQVDCIFYSTGTTVLFSHNTKVGEIHTAKTGGFEKNLTKEFLEQGLDPLQIMVDFSHQHNIEVFWSMRMNDEHGLWYPELLSQFHKDHPEYLLGTEEKQLPHGPWCGLDFTQPGVRDQVFRVIEEVCNNYEIDGLELDFFRQLTCFKSAAWGQPVTQEERDMMTELLRRVRTMTEEVAQERRRPMLIAVRVPDCPEFSRALGLDWEQWLQEDLFDILVVGSYFQLRPWEDTVQLGHQYDVPVYPCLENPSMGAPRHGPDRMARYAEEAYRAWAMNVWNSGADGVYLFNFNYYFDPEHPLWRELGDPEILQPLDKLYHLSVMATGHPSVNRYLPEGDQFVRVPVLSPDHPVTLAVGEPQTTTLTVGDNVLWGKEQGIVPELKLALRVDSLLRPQDLSVKLNGQVLSYGILRAFEYGWLEYTLNPEMVKQGANSLELLSTHGAEVGGEVPDVVVQDCQLQVHYIGMRWK